MKKFILIMTILLLPAMVLSTTEFPGGITTATQAEKAAAGQ